ncbi:MFS transporter [Paenibacillus sp. J5C_2022]|uniref:MFS transporter n=1 Tax=Paenibacillus sp. J5C2022 TaxID=2977129 RepID=UPI0021D0D49A|nr:MFS transporter [Paenibacillus sp. J5C2022]MCU6707424.1 MFS transporter [Paenibacillus sp. J5C2022]
MKNRIAVLLLALGAFGVGTAEFIISGLLELIAGDLDVSVSVAGQLITVYALSHAFGALVLVMLTARLERKKVLLYAMLVFAAGNLLSFVSYHYGWLMLSRIVLAISGGLYFVVATYYAARLAPPDKRGSAIATVITGFTVSLVLGVPIGTYLAAYMDWRYIFLIMAIVSLMVIMLLYRFIPMLEGSSPVPLKQQLKLICDKKLVSGLLTTLFWILGYTIVFAYIAPILSKTAGFSLQQISTAIFLLGIFAFIGSRVGGYAVDRWGPVSTIGVSLVIHAASLIALMLISQSMPAVFIMIIVWGLAAWTTTPANQYYMISLKPQSAEIILSVNTALLNIGITLGAALGGLVIEYAPIHALGWIGGISVLLALAVAAYSFSLKSGNLR